MKLTPNETLAAALALLGQPNEKLSKGAQLRWRSKGSMSVDVARGCWFDHEAGVGGYMVALAQHVGVASNFLEARDWLKARGWYGAHSHPQSQRIGRHSQANVGRSRAIQILGETQAIKGTLAERYLRSRAIRPPWPDAVRFHPHLWCAETAARLPAMVCAISPLRAPDSPHAVLRTWLTPDGGKAKIKSPRKILGLVAGGAVVLAPFHSRLIIAEGVETALSVDEVWGTSAIATLGTANMEAVQIPATVEDVLIAFDRDAHGAGEIAARKLATRLHAEGRAVTLIPPPAAFNDWNDYAQSRDERRG